MIFFLLLEIATPEVVVVVAFEVTAPLVVAVEVVVEVVDVELDVLAVEVARADAPDAGALDVVLHDRLRDVHHARCRLRRRRPTGLDGGEPGARAGDPLGEWKEHATGDHAGKS
ncbi:hypothetical protein ABGB18_14200 [Nonomuraea sp. B12E4]|uniref:hypothetical protein n=1 Tax=Nonomuraea sp. B12E4 TaxID=3153564 RepID=UPI00325CD967